MRLLFYHFFYYFQQKKIFTLMLYILFLSFETLKEYLKHQSVFAFATTRITTFVVREKGVIKVFLQFNHLVKRK